MPKRKFRAWPCAALSFAPFSVVLADDGPSPEEPIETVVVTASRVAVPAAQVGSSVTVITEEMLATRRPTFVADALRDVPGVAMSRGGGYGAVTQARIRGAEGNHTLVLIDGVEANNPISGSEFDFANLAATDIERIEVLRGPQSALYGSDAIGGVINVITRGAAPGFDGTFGVEAGNLGTHAAKLSAGGGTSRASGRVHAARIKTDGSNISRFGTERDGFDSETLRLDGRFRVGDVWSVRANAHALDSEQDFDTQDFAFPETETQGLVVDDDVSSRLEQRFASIDASAELPRTAYRFRAARTKTRNTFLDGGVFTGRNEGDKTKLDWQATIALGPLTADGPVGSGHGITLALEHERVDYLNVGATPDAAENQSRDDSQTSIVAEYRRVLGRAALSASVRHDDNDLFDDASTYRLSGTFAAAERTRVRASVGTGITNPGFFELFGFFPGSFVGNPALTPERSTSFDVGIEHRLGRARVDVTYFRADLEDEIVTVFDETSFLTTAENLPGESERRGVELAVSAAPTARWNVAASYTYTDARQPDGSAEVRRPRHVASLDNALELVGGRARLNVGIDYTGRQLDDEFVFATPEERVELDAFVLVNVAGSIDISPRLRLYARVENALDETYEEWFSYRGRGRSWLVGFETELGR